MASFKLVSLKDFIPRTFELFSKKQEKKYSWNSLGKDCISGITVGIIALPLAMAFGIAAGGTPAQGLYTAVFAGFFISFLGGSKYQIGGPTGAFVVIIYGIITRHGMDGLVIATILAGIMLIIMGLSGLGRFIKYIPYPVTTGFTTGIGVLIFSQQIKDFFGLSIEKSSPEFFEKWSEYIHSAASFNGLTFAIGTGTILVIVIARKFIPRIPGAVIGVVISTVVCAAFSLPVDTIGSRFGGIPSSLPIPSIPRMNISLINKLIPDAFTIALLAAIESLLSAVVADGMTGDKHKGNVELAAQGVGNIASGLFCGIPATGAIARTAANIKSGATSPVSGMIHAIFLVLFIYFLSPIASLIPLASLSAVLMTVAWDMSNLGRFTSIIRRAPKSDSLVLLTTFVLTVVVDLTFAVEVGMVLAIFLFFKRMIDVGNIKIEETKITDQIIYENSEDHIGQQEQQKGIEIFEINGPFFFGVADLLQDTLKRVSRSPHTFILRMRAVPAVDATGIAALESFLAQCRRRKIKLILCEIQKQPRKALAKTGFIDELGEDCVQDSLKAAISLAGKTQ